MAKNENFAARKYAGLALLRGFWGAVGRLLRLFWDFSKKGAAGLR